MPVRPDDPAEPFEQSATEGSQRLPNRAHFRYFAHLPWLPALQGEEPIEKRENEDQRER